MAKEKKQQQKSNVKPIVKINAKPVAKPAAKAVAKADAKPDTKAVAKADTKPNVKLNRRERGVRRFYDRMIKYFRDMFSELKKATWPTKKELFRYTGVVLAFVVILAVVVGLMDLGLTQLLKLITG